MNNKLDTLLKKSIDYAIFQNTDSNCQKQIGIAFRKGYEDCQKEYEEKLRWIPVHEKMPEQLTYIELKDSCDRIFSGSLNMQNEFRDRLHNDKLHFIVSWRSFL